MTGKIYLALDTEGVEHVFEDWSACQAYVHGKPYRFCAAPTVELARARLSSQGSAPTARQHRPRPQPPRNARGRPVIGLCSDAGTHGNPGPCEYQVADLDGNILKHEHLGIGTNNFAELAGIAAALEVAYTRGVRIVWTDSQVCLAWIRSGRVGESVAQRDRVLSLVASIRQQIKQAPGMEIRKWETRSWGEIPADFGRKT